MSYRLSAKQIFLTYPQCDLNISYVRDFLKSKAAINSIIVAQELHQDGSPHVHAYVSYQKKIDIKKPDYFDIDSFHPNVQGVRCSAAVAKYCQKGGNFLQEGCDIFKDQVARQGKKKILGKRLLSERLVDVIQDHPELIFDYKKIKANIMEFKKDSIRNQLATCGDVIPNTWDIIMPLTTAKQRHYWVYSDDPNKGKTTWLNEIASLYRCSWYNYQESFQDIYEDSQFLLMDEFSSAHIKVTQLNQMCDGTYQYPNKGGSPIQIKLIILVCGNKDPKLVYPNAWPFIEARFNVIPL